MDIDISEVGFNFTYQILNPKLNGSIVWAIAFKNQTLSKEDVKKRKGSCFGSMVHEDEQKHTKEFRYFTLNYIFSISEFFSNWNVGENGL